MTLRYIRMTREDYEKKMRNTKLYFLGEALKDECCPTCGEHDFFNWIGPNGLKTRKTGKEMIEAWKKQTIVEHVNCAACHTIPYVKDDKIVWDKHYVHYTPEQFREALEIFYKGDINKFIVDRYKNKAKMFDWLEEHYPNDQYDPDSDE